VITQSCEECGDTFIAVKLRSKCLDCYRKELEVEDGEEDDYDED